MTDRELMERAIAELVADPDNRVTGAYIGGLTDAGQTSKRTEYWIVCQVGKKLSADELFAKGIKPVPRKVAIEGYEDREFLTKVEEAPAIYRPLILKVDPDNPPNISDQYNPRSFARNLQECQSPTIIGGAQIAPQGAGWVGTNGCAIRLSDDSSYGCLTNWHVANGGQFGEGSLQCQPHGRGPVFGRLRRWINIDTRGGDNLVDCSYIEDQRWKDSSGEFVFCVPSQYVYGKLRTDFYKASEINIGLKVQKSGRTTGHTKGQVTGISGTFHIGYDGGTARFVRQIQIRGDGGQFSGPGDSGSLICDMNNRPVCLLFAGGGNDTIANPIEFVVDKLKLEFWRN